MSELTSLSGTAAIVLLLGCAGAAFMGVIMSAVIYSLVGKWPTIGVWFVFLANAVWVFWQMDRELRVFVWLPFLCCLAAFIAVVFGPVPNFLRKRGRIQR